MITTLSMAHCIGQRLKAKLAAGKFATAPVAARL